MTAFRRQEIAVLLGDLLDQTVCAEQSQTANDAATGAQAGLDVTTLHRGVKPGAQVPVAESVHMQLATSQELEHSKVLGIPGIDGAKTTAVSGHTAANAAQRLFEGFAERRGRYVIKITFIAGLADLAPAIPFSIVRFRFYICGFAALGVMA